MSDHETVGRPISHSQFAKHAARIAQKASGWAADCLLHGRLGEPMRQEALDRFTREITDLVEACNGRP